MKSTKDRSNPQSRARFSYLSPQTLTERLKKRKYQLHNKPKTCSPEKIDETVKSSDLDISPNQADDLWKAFDAIQTKHSELIEDLVNQNREECNDNFASLLTAAWQLDQSRNSRGKNGNRWNWLTIRMMLSLRSKSPAVYRELEKIPFFSIPSERTLKRTVADCFRFPSGSNCQEHLAQQMKIYSEHAARTGTV